MFYVSIVYEQGIGNLKMDEEFKSFLLKKKISEEKYDGMTGELQFKWRELFEKSKPQGKIFVHYIMSLIWCCDQSLNSFVPNILTLSLIEADFKQIYDVDKLTIRIFFHNFSLPLDEGLLFPFICR